MKALLHSYLARAILAVAKALNIWAVWHMHKAESDLLRVRRGHPAETMLIGSIAIMAAWLWWRLL